MTNDGRSPFSNGYGLADLIDILGLYSVYNRSGAPRMYGGPVNPGQPNNYTKPRGIAPPSNDIPKYYPNLAQGQAVGPVQSVGSPKLPQIQGYFNNQIQAQPMQRRKMYEDMNQAETTDSDTSPYFWSNPVR